MISPAQIKLVQIARRQLGLEEADYRLILRNLGGVESTTKLTHRGMEDVMAFFEARGFVDRLHGPGYWQRQRDAEGGREIRLIKQLAAESAYPLAALCQRHSHHRTSELTELNAMERYELIEMLKASNNRAGNRRAAQKSAADPPDESAERTDPIPF